MAVFCLIFLRFNVNIPHSSYLEGVLIYIYMNIAHSSQLEAGIMSILLLNYLKYE